jgi:hypothetical protein
MSATLQQFAELAEFLEAQRQPALARDLALAAVRHLPSRTPQERLSLSVFASETLYRCKYYEESVAWAREACVIAPGQPQLYFQLARALVGACREDEAEPILRSLYESFPGQKSLAIDLSISLFYQGKFDEAQALLENVLSTVPETQNEHRIARFNLHWHWMRTGRFKDSMRVFLAAEDKFELKRPELKHSDDLRGKRLLILHRDGGAGDEIVNVRFAKYFAAKGAHVIWRTRHRFGSLFLRAQGIHEIVDTHATPDPNVIDFDYWIGTGDLIKFLDFDLPDVSREPYLFAEPGHLEKWSRLIPNHGKLRVGLRWQGTMATELDMHRSVPFAEYRKLFDLSGVEFYSIQRDGGLEEILPLSRAQDVGRRGRGDSKPRPRHHELHFDRSPLRRARQENLALYAGRMFLRLGSSGRYRPLVSGRAPFPSKTSAPMGRSHSDGSRSTRKLLDPLSRNQQQVDTDFLALESLNHPDQIEDRNGSQNLFVFESDLFLNPQGAVVASIDKSQNVENRIPAKANMIGRKLNLHKRPRPLDQLARATKNFGLAALGVDLDVTNPLGRFLIFD